MLVHFLLVVVIWVQSFEDRQHLGSQGSIDEALIQLFCDVTHSLLHSIVGCALDTWCAQHLAKLVL